MSRKLVLAGLTSLAALSACAEGADGEGHASVDAYSEALVAQTGMARVDPAAPRTSAAQPPVQRAPEAPRPVPTGVALTGKNMFNTPLQQTNGRSCGTCHVEAESFALSPANVEARLASNPSDPLFNRIDADDPNASTLTYENLKKGLVRVKLRLPENVDLLQVPPEWTAFAPAGAAQAWWAQNVVPGSRIGDALPPGKLPEIITPADRIIEVWRSVPSVENTAYSGRFLFDGRAATLEEQAIGALQGHSEVGAAVGLGQLDAIAAYERTLFSSEHAQTVFNDLVAKSSKTVPLFNEDGSTNLAVVNQVAKPEAADPLLQRGQPEYERFCTACHGKATDDRVESEVVRAGAIFEVDADGNLLWQFIPGVGAVPVNTPRPGNEALNIGAAFISYLGQVTKNLPPQLAFPTFNQGATLPRYRLRFYTDDSRTVKRTDLPPLPFPDANNPFAFAFNEQGLPVVGPNFGPQLWSTDPGVALQTGDYADMEAMNIPQLRGIADTAPYFHDNSNGTLEAVVDTYSLFILPFIPSLNPLGAIPGQHAMTDTQRADLVDFLKKF